jgi:hypothetical protein
MLDLLPLPAVKEATQSAFLLLDSNKPNTGDLERHLKTYHHFQEITELHPLSSCMPLIYDLGVFFEKEAPVYYTDGFRRDGLTGIGIYGPSVRNFGALGSTSTLF